MLSDVHCELSQYGFAAGFSSKSTKQRSELELKEAVLVVVGKRQIETWKSF